MALETENKTDIIKKFSTAEGDTGSPEVQVALLTGRIELLNKNFNDHKQDHGSRQGLLKLVGRRRKLLAFLKREDVGRYQKLIGELGLRK